MTETKFNPNTGADTTVTIRFPQNNKVSTTTPRFSIGYWSIRGLGAPLRMMLSASKTDHTILLHDLVEDDESTTSFPWKSAYFSHKPDIVKHYNPFMNLPYLIDYEKEIIICQTNAIFNYLGRELEMCGEGTALDQVKCDELLCEVYDLRNLVVAFSYRSSGSKEEAETLVKNCKKHLLKFNTYLDMRDVKCHLVGRGFTAPDFHLFEMIDQLDGLCKEYDLEDVLKEYTNVREFKVAFENLSENAFYLKQSKLHTDLPMNNCTSKFGSNLDAKVFQRGQDAPWRKRGSITIVCEDGGKKQCVE